MKNIYRFIRLPFGGFVPLGFLFVVFCLFAITNPLRAQWIQTNGPSGVSSTNCLAVSGTNLFAGTNKGVFLTTDNGTTWSAVNTGLPTNTTVNALAIGGTNILPGLATGFIFQLTMLQTGVRLTPASLLFQQLALLQLMA